ncbi:LPXTG cell wall anchor domain-containing protein [Staphylococcus croceilyticus]|uniref:LPXTG cell wall anchor domain-containing protein n=1 Tax=Staphylococcus croceilyticus TaxID=319942 RepID=A0ABY2KHK9_9STAP|nr:LPXTG cell wall anchor domain-containing protein [Staphylococcus croceilyticus]PNZ71064.1 hypothetical protein CD128_00515 [Staphylococcus croceilyticus]TGA80176.1 LPXTG cell wall anchor domain-containing protein [Staphylococcus croceilyticus]
MKKSSIFATTTLTGALLFSGVGAHQAHAAENVSKSQAEKNVQDLVTNNSNYHPKEGTKYTVMDEKYADPNHPKNSYSVAFGEEPNQSPSFLYVNKETGNVYDANGNLVQKASTNSENNQAKTNNTRVNSSNTNQESTVNHNNQSNASTINNNNASTQNNEQQTTKALPETGEQFNSDLITIIASVLLAAGSLLTFKRFSSNK